MTEIPASFLDLIQGPRVAAFTTLMPDGSPSLYEESYSVDEIRTYKVTVTFKGDCHF